MGWTSYHATHYKNGSVDRLKECEQIMAQENKEKNMKWTPIKICMVGKVCYAAVQFEEDGKREVFAEIILTSTKMKDYYNFSYKNMDETCGPCYYDCPDSILNLLSPTDNEYALQWREKCKEENEKKKTEKSNKDSLARLPIGSIIEMPYWDGGTKTLTKRNYHNPKTIWTDGCFRYTTPTIKRQGYTVIKRGDET